MKILLIRQLITFVLLGLSALTHAAELDLSLYKGKIVYLDFWASWCWPCRKSFPWMNEMQKKIGKENLVVIAINLDQERHLADEFIREFSPEFTILYDPQGALATEYKVAAMPSAFLMDRKGNLRFKHLGYHHNKISKYEEELQLLLQETAD
jgi:thiol-disulfide isomerase/thioredoxin